MKLKEIIQINDEPFQEKVIHALASIANESPKIHYMYNILVLYYFNQFQKEYECNWKKVQNVGRMIGCSTLGVSEEDYFIDNQNAWAESVNEYMIVAMEKIGWHIDILYIENDELNYELHFDCDLNSEKCTECVPRWLEKFSLSKDLKQVLSKNKKIICDTLTYLEDGEIVVFWNSKLSQYIKLKERNKKLIEKVCKEEDNEIVRLEKEIVFLTLYYNDYSISKENECYYMLSLGSNGYEYCGIENFNPNWIYKAYKLDKLLDSALKKLDNDI